MFLISLALLACAPVDDPHEQLNPLYRELRQKGLAIGPNIQVQLPEPTMLDGLDAKAQKDVIIKLGGGDFTFDELTRKSQVAPKILRLRDIDPSDPKAPAHGVDVWFIAYGNLQALKKTEFLDQMLATGKKQGKARDLTREHLKKRGLAILPAHEKNEGYGHTVFTLFDKVEISVTGRSFVSQTDHSLLVATRMEPAFTRDKEFPNQWRSLIRGDDGETKLGPPTPYEGAAFYVKVTRLVKPAGALFVESHSIFAEPHGWFNGANFLRSKLPLAVQGNVRSFRRELLKASR